MEYDNIRKTAEVAKAEIINPKLVIIPPAAARVLQLFGCTRGDVSIVVTEKKKSYRL